VESYYNRGLGKRDQSILIGLYLSKFDINGLKSLGFTTFREACNTFGLALGAKPASIKNYRDELDPYFPNARKGWHKRPLRSHCKLIYEKHKDLDMEAFQKIICHMTMLPLKGSSSGIRENEPNTFAKRLMTGKAAENYFIEHYAEEPEFQDAALFDFTYSGCGYDYQLTHNDNYSFAVEVKGLQSLHGSISMTEKEHRIASELEGNFFLYIVSNFEDSPTITNIRNPANSWLTFSKIKREIVQVSWNAAI